MSLDAFDAMLKSFDLDACVRFFDGMPEKERKTYAERAFFWQEVASAFAQEPSIRPWISFPTQMPKRAQEQLALIRKVREGVIRMPREAQSPQSLEIIRLALTACAGLSDLRKLPLPSPVHAVAIIRSRKPKWLDRWVNLACERNPHGFWELARKFETDGITVERGDGYWLSMCLSLGQKEASDLINYLQTNKEVRDELFWTMFENEQAVRALSDPTGIHADSRFNRNSTAVIDWRQWGQRLEECRRASYLWKIVISDLAREQQISQSRVLDLIFNWLLKLSSDEESKASNGLGGELSPAGWFQSLHDELQLSARQESDLVNNYIGLLSVKDSSTLSWAIQNLLECSLNDESTENLLSNLSRVFYIKRKEPALNAVKLIEHMQRNNAVGNARLADLALEAFEHTSSDIHKRALSYLKKSKSLDDVNVVSALASRVDRMAGLIKKEVLELLANSSIEIEASSGKSMDAASYDLESLISQAASHNDELGRLAQIDEVLLAITADGAFPKSLSLDSLDIPRLNPAKVIQPISNLDDLIFLYLHVLEGSSSVDDVERLLDGLMRVGHHRPADFENQVSSLRKKVQTVLENMQKGQSSFFPFNGVSPLIDLQGLAIAWLDSKPANSEKSLLKSVIQNLGLDKTLSGLPSIIQGAIERTYGYAAPMAFFAERLKAIAKILPRRVALPLLAAPTHQGGWIDPRVIPSRLLLWDQAGIKPEMTDLIQALLRLAPEHRSEALDLLPSSNDEYMRALRWALGDEMKAPIETAELWVAALRCREPRSSDKFLQARFPELGPDAACLATYAKKIDEYKARPNGVFGGGWNQQSQNLPIESVPAVKFRSKLKLFPTELLHDSTISFESSDLIELYFLLYRESYFAYTARHMALYIDSQGTYWRNSWDPLFDPDVPLSGMGTWLLAFALSAKQPEAARLALDALINGIEESRLDAPAFGEILALVFATDKITLSRWISAFKEVSRVSQLHVYFIALAFETFLAKLPSEYAAKPPISILELMSDLCLSSGFAVKNDSARKFLGEIQGKGKAAKLAKTLLELPPGKEADYRKSVLCQILQLRIDRAVRWKTWLEKSSMASSLN